MTKPTNWGIGVLKIGLLGVIIAAYCYLPCIHDFVTQGIIFFKCRDFEGLRNFILSYGVWAPATSIGLMAILSIIPFLPGLAITISNAWIFGWQYGALYPWIGALLGAILDFGIARWYGRPVVERFINKKYLDLTDEFFIKHGVWAVFITRLTPVIPFKVVSYGAGLTSLSLYRFSLSTGIGQTPAIVVYSILGQNIIHSLHAALTVTSLLIVAGILFHCYRETIEHYFFPKKE